ncbi:unnamed protein product [Blepharisma stoltei]|uniref:EF-hand domain-containing protein n=1 Tax=Blepharisma stoltei TaxID=1481888 RepID=A0AAU9K602_9CILI|nr:unnamed protein product [Blepharisma stoltei]
MGNYLIQGNQSTSLASYLLKPVDFSMQILTKWILSDIMFLYKRFIRLHTGKGFLLSRAEVKRLARVSPMGGMEDVIFNAFHMFSSQKLNILEIFAAAITYSDMELNEKLKLAMYIFDLDGSKYLTKDEVLLLCRSFIRAIGNMTRGPEIEEPSILVLCDTFFSVLNKNTNGKISLDDLKNLVFLNQTLTELLNKNIKMKELKIFATENSPRNKTPLIKRGHRRVETIGASPFTIKARATSRQRDTSATSKVRRSSFRKKRTDNFSVSIGNELISRCEANRFYEVFKAAAKGQNVAISFLIHNLMLQERDLVYDADLIPQTSEIMNFTQMLSMIYRNATPAEIRRLVRIIDPNLEPETPILENNQEYRKRLSFRTAKIYPQLFDKFEKDKDGFIGFKALKKVLGDKFQEENLHKLYDQYRTDKGIDLQGFIMMFAPNNSYITQDVLHKLLTYNVKT